MKTKSALGIIARVACVLLCLVLFSAHLCSGMFARYNSGGEVTGSATVAKANIVVDSVPPTQSGEDPVPVTFDDAGNGSYTFKVTNDSEVALRVDILVELKTRATSDFDPDDFYSDDDESVATKLIKDIKLGGNAPAESGVNSDGTAYYLFTGAADFAPEDSENMTLSLIADVDAVTDEDVDKISLDQISFDASVTAKATQIN